MCTETVAAHARWVCARDESAYPITHQGVPGQEFVARRRPPPPGYFTIAIVTTLNRFGALPTGMLPTICFLAVSTTATSLRLSTHTYHTRPPAPQALQYPSPSIASVTIYF